MPSEHNPDESIRDWEPMQVNGTDDRTERLRVAGGWLYRTVLADVGVALVFVSATERDEA